MSSFHVAELQDKLRGSAERYLEFLSVPSMSMGLYELAAGEADLQSPHTEDEAYFVLRGKAILRVEDIDHEVEAGSIVYVAANVPHKFHTITEDLSLLVFFAPAEYSAAKASQ